MISPYYIKPLV